MAGVNLRIAPPVRKALDRRAAVVALESTLITHGLPRPRNLELARQLEEDVRQAGAVPATVGVIGGECVVGLNDGELERLAAGGADKASTWNLAALVARGADAGTTVATTLHLAAAAGIAVFATGGIGGVHDAPYDESADLAALARSRLVTVCAGPKSILNARATLERLESAGVPVVGYRSSRLAGFHLPTTDLPLATRVEDAEGIAALFRAQSDLDLPQGVLVSNPVSKGLDADALEGWLRTAEERAREAGVSGRDATPFLLDALARLSDGRTVEVNVRLLRENAVLAAEIARALAPSTIGVPA